MSYKDTEEGAAIAAERLCKALIQSNNDSVMLVQSKVSDFPFVNTIVRNRFDKLTSLFRIGIDLLINKVMICNTYEYFSLPLLGANLSNESLLHNADVIHLHWINRGYVTIRTLKRLAKLKKPIIWTLHDSWAFTGGCHMTGACEKYITGCDKCEYIRCNRISNKLVKKKKKIYDNLNLTIIAPSSWMKDRAEKSYLLKDKKITVIPNSIDTDIFKPIDKALSREILNLPTNKKIILFFMNRNIRKGNSIINNVLSKLKNIDEYEFISFGSSYVYTDIFKQLKIRCYGKVNDAYMLSLLYNASDVYISPALEEPFGQTYTEAMACGTPCVGFDFSGPKDIIDHLENGYLAEYMNEDDLVKGIEYCMDNYDSLSKASINKVNNVYSFKQVAFHHIELYNEVRNG
jgi:glycosyltransferase involved in cell wall biosynthesis